MDAKDRRLWAIGNDAETVHDDQGGALGAYVDEIDEAPKPGETVTLFEYKPMELPESWMGFDSDLLATIYERLDEDWRDPCAEDGTVPHEDVAAAADALWAAIRRTYRVWMCEPTGRTEVVDFHAWCVKNAPEVVRE